MKTNGREEASLYTQKKHTTRPEEGRRKRGKCVEHHVNDTQTGVHGM